MGRNLWRPVVVAIAASVGGCGWVVPKIDPSFKTPYDTGIFVNRVANQVKCELGKAVYDVIAEYQEKDNNPVGWLVTWGAKATLKIIVDEKSNVSPSVLVTPPGVFSIGADASLSAEATRTETIGFFLVFADLLDPKTHKLPAKAPEVCAHYSDVLIESDLKLKEWVEAVGLLASTPRTVSNPFVSGGPLDTTSHEVQFIITVSGDTTPVWKLVSVTANPGSPFLGGSRARTDDLLITMGPLDVVASGRALRPSQAIETAHLGAQLQSITTAIQNQRR
jgi:hypothetical protein